MTYIIGLGQPGLNAIISDTRATREDALGESNAVKTGILFNGCIFGRVGNAYYSAQFLRRFQAGMDSENVEQAYLWHQLHDFVQLYDDYPSAQHNSFQIVLSTRAFGQPEFWLLDSRNRTLEPIGNSQWLISHDGYRLVSFGSGGAFLDEKISEDLHSWLGHIRDKMHQMCVPVEQAQAVVPYCLCLWLMQMSVGQERHAMEQRRGVGGVFHFVSQNLRGESRQDPAVYILSYQGNRGVHLLEFRVVGCGDGVYVKECAPGSSHLVTPFGQQPQSGPLEYILLNTIAQKDVPIHKRGEPDALSSEYTQRLSTRIVQKVDSSPYFWFCGFGFLDPRHRHELMFACRENGQRTDIFGPEGGLLPEHRRFVEEVLAT